MASRRSKIRRRGKKAAPAPDSAEKVVAKAVIVSGLHAIFWPVTVLIGTFRAIRHFFGGIGRAFRRAKVEGDGERRKRRRRAALEADDNSRSKKV